MPNGFGRVEHEAHDVDVVDAVERGGVDPLAERRHRLVQAGRVDEHELGVGRVEHAAHAVRVVCGLSLTIDTFVPQIALTSVDLPTLGRPTSVTKPLRKIRLSSRRRGVVVVVEVVGAGGFSRSW